MNTTPNFRELAPGRLEEVLRAGADVPPGAQWLPDVQRVMAAWSREFLAGLRRPASAGEGRGVVTCGGGTKYFPGVYALAARLREVGCTLPVEVWHQGPGEMDPGMARLLEPLGASCIDARALQRAVPWRKHGGWELKPYAALYSRFREVLFLDADNAPAKDPAYLFDAPEYLRHGAAFWPDYPTWTLDHRIWQALGLPLTVDAQGWTRETVKEFFGRPIPDGVEPPFESGQFLVDKARCWAELRLAGWLCEHSDYYFRLVYGDKETFRIAWRMACREYALPRVWPGWESHTMYQHDFAGEVVFYHRTQDKPLLDGANRRSNVPGEAQLLDAVRRLREAWNGQPWVNGRPTPAEAEVAQALEGLPLNVPGGGSIKLAAGGVVECGGAAPWRWSVFCPAGETLLAVTTGEAEPKGLFRFQGGGLWLGKWDGQPANLAAAARTPRIAQEPRGDPDGRTAGAAPPDAACATPAAVADMLEKLPKHTVPDPRPLVGVVMPLWLNNRELWELTKKAAATLNGRQCGVRLFPVLTRLNVDGLTPKAVAAELEKLAGCRVEVLQFPPDRAGTVAGAWNAGTAAAVGAKCDFALLRANNVPVDAGALDALARYGANVKTYDGKEVMLWSGSPSPDCQAEQNEVEGAEFSCVMFRPSLLYVVGLFDENFRPAYFEDNDYHARVVLAGGTARVVLSAPFRHYGSATVKTDPEADRAVRERWAQNLAYFARKWGRDKPVNGEREMLALYHKTPFNEPGRPLSWWPRFGQQEAYGVES